MSLAPIILFVYNRPDHTLRTLESLMKNDLAGQSEIYIYCDGPKKSADTEALNKIKQVRKIIRLKQWCGKVNIIESAINQTHPVNVITKITEIINRYDKIIVLEDDLVTGKGFLKYMNEALDLYQNHSEVMHISGYLFPVLKRNLPETFFLNYMSVWGWATWKRAWDHFIPDPKELLNRFPKDGIYRFNMDGSENHYHDLVRCAEGPWCPWDIRWYASFFIKKGFGLYPRKSLVRNIGHDGSGMHTVDSYLYSYQQIIDYVRVEKINIEECPKARKALKQLYNYLYDKSFFSLNNFKNISRKLIFPGLYNYLKKERIFNIQG